MQLKQFLAKIILCRGAQMFPWRRCVFFYKNAGWPFFSWGANLANAIESIIFGGESNRAIVRDFADIEKSVDKNSIAIQTGV